VSSLVYLLILLGAISFWLVGYIYVKKQNQLLAYENEIAILRAKTKHKLEALEKQKQEILKQIENIQQEIAKLEKPD